MNISHLRYAVEVEKTGSITRAAENLYMGQPNLSKAIKELENSVGITLFRRTYHGVSPTAKGKVFLDQAREVLSKIQEMESLYQNEEQTLAFSICIPRASYVSYGIAQFISGLDQSKGFSIDIQETNTLRTLERVVNGECNMGIMRCVRDRRAYYMSLIQEKHLHSESLWVSRFLVVMSESNPLASKAVLTLDDLQDAICLEHGDEELPFAPRERRSSGRHQNEKSILVYERGSQLDMLRYVPNTYMWVTAIPRPILESMGLVLRACEPDSNWVEDILIYPQYYHLTDLDQAFIDNLQMVRDEMGSCIETDLGISQP